MNTFVNDLRFAARTLRKQPAFTTTVIATLALAIGASTAIFSVVESTLLRPLPFQTPERLAFLWGVAGPQRAIRGASIIEIEDWARLTHSFEQIAIYDETSLSLRTTEGADRVDAEMVSASYFPMLGATAAVGRVFTPQEDRVPDANPVVVISDAMWTTRFGRDPHIVGRAVTLNDQPFTIVGVMRPGFKGLSFDTDVWFPAMMAHANGAPKDLTSRGNRWLGAVGRLGNGVTIDAAQADAARAAAQLAKDFPESNRDRGVQLFALRDSYLGSTRTLVLAVFGAVGLLLLIACANVVGLQLVRATGRRREFALRIAIGAGRGRLVRQLVAEGLVLAACSTLIGLLVAYWSLEGLIHVIPPGLLPNYAAPSIDPLAFAFAVAVAAVSGLLVGIVPAFRATQVDLTTSLKQGSRGSAGDFSRGRRLGIQQILIIAELALALVLLVGAGLFVRSLQRQLAVDAGFDAAGVVRAQLSLPQQLRAPQRLQFADALEARAAAVPSVRGAAIGSDMPLGGSSSAAFVYLPDAAQSVRFYRHMVSANFFSTLRIPVIRGRGFTAEDRDGTPNVVVINDAMARRFWSGASPIGKTLRLGSETGPEVTIVGVVGDVRYRDLTTPLATSEPDVYFPLAQFPTSSLQIAVRSDLPAASIGASMRREVAAIDPTVPLYNIESLQALLDRQTASGRFASTLLSVFGTAALLLTAIGLYGALAFLVSLRLREMGIRIALGATQARVVRGIIAHGLRLAIGGAAIGLVAAWLLTRWIATQLYGVGSHDPLVFAVVPALMLAVAAAASWVPARRAARADPQIALRTE
jgi:predicted permease